MFAIYYLTIVIVIQELVLEITRERRVTKVSLLSGTFCNGMKDIAFSILCEGCIVSHTTLARANVRIEPR